VFVLDTDVLSELRRRRPNQALLRWLAAVEWRELATTAITIMEIRFGIETARRGNPEVAIAVEQWLAGLLEAGGPQILPLDTPAAQILGRMYAVPALRALTGVDLAMIAALAISRQAVVATNNVADFQSIHRHFALAGLFDPLTGEWHIPHAGTAEPGG
jgi:predicted nucleic acid-binding protein